MPCFKPLKAYKNPNTGGIQFHSPYSDLDNSFPIPCRQCTGCRTEYARQWAMRLVLEQQAWDNNIFITLTYDNEHLPEHNTLVKKDFQLFMNRLRKKKSDTVFSCGRIRRKIRPSTLSCNTIQY